MDIFINGIGMISPQETLDNNKFLETIIPFEGSYFKMAEPPYKEHIPARELRRMSKIIRNGIVAGKTALKEADLTNPQAIITGTGLGCAIDTEKFLVKMMENKEQFLTPTSFIQSTHNTLGGSIAIGLDCHAYNMTYVHRGLSFETALMDAQMMLQDGEAENILIGGFDEMTDKHIQLLQATDQYHPVHGAKAGQVSGFFVLEKEKKEQSYAQLLALEMLYNPQDTVLEASQILKDLMAKHKVDLSKTAVILGYNGIANEEVIYNEIAKKLQFNSIAIANFKHLCGESYTASAFALWMGAQILHKQSIPTSISYNNCKTEEIEHLLIYNQFQEKEHAFMLLKRC